ncbi:hypothetical protein GN956_G24385 [Arapaima gigas]
MKLTRKNKSFTTVTAGASSCLRGRGAQGVINISPPPKRGDPSKSLPTTATLCADRPAQTPGAKQTGVLSTGMTGGTVPFSRPPNRLGRAALRNGGGQRLWHSDGEVHA